MTTDPLDSIVAALAQTAEGNLTRAYRELGATPTGQDIMVRYVGKAITGLWSLEPISPAGTAFIGLFYRNQPLRDRAIAQFKHHAAEWGLGIAYDFEAIEEPLA